MSLIRRSGISHVLPLECPLCKKRYSRSDALRRHQRERHHKRRDGDRNNQEFLCPHAECKRSAKGLGFQRSERLQRHLNTCKYPKISTALACEVTPAARSSSQLQMYSGGSSSGSAGDSPMQGDCRIPKPSNEASGKHHLLLELQRRYKHEEENLRELERECQAKKDLLVSINTLINNL